MSIGRRVVRGVCRWSTACVLLLIRAAPVLMIFAFLLPASAQWGNSQWGNSQWGNSWGGRQQQPYNPYGGYGHEHKWDNWGYRQREMASSPLFFFNDTATTEIYTLSLHDAPPATPPASASATAPTSSASAGRTRPSWSCSRV